MDEGAFRRYRKISNSHTAHCLKCGRPKRLGCRFQGCNEVQHCACDMTNGVN